MLRLLLILCLVTWADAAETLTLVVSRTANPGGPAQAPPANAVAIWVTSTAVPGTLVRTIGRWVGSATNPKRNNGWQGLPWWFAAAGSSGDVDGYMGATRSSATGNLFTGSGLTWDLKAKGASTTVADGSYTVWMELATDNLSKGATFTSGSSVDRFSFAFTKNGTPSSGTIAASRYTGTWSYAGRAPVVASLSPAGGTTAGGTSVTLTGTGFTGATGVTFGGTAATSVSVVSATQITCVAPANAAGAVDVVVTTAAGPGTLAAGYAYATPGSVGITSLSPATGTTAGGTSVTITGTGLTGTSSVTFGGVAATSLSGITATQVTCVAPAHAAGAVTVALVATAGSASLPSGYTYVPPAPTVAGVAPASGTTLGGTTVTITGSNFLTGATTVTIGGVAASSVSVASATQLTCVTPTHALGAVNVVVTTAGGSATATGAFTYTAPGPSLSSLSPSQGALAGGTSVTISGSNLSGTTAVTFGGVAATAVTVVDGTTVTCTTPAGTGAVDVVLTSAGQTATLAGAYTYSAGGGTAYVSFIPSSAGGGYAPKHVLAVWIETAAGNYVRTIGDWSDVRRGNLTLWQSRSGGDSDGVMGATRSAIAPVNRLTWDLRDQAGATVADGTYDLWIELADDNSPTVSTGTVSGARRTHLSFTVAGGAVQAVGPVSQDGFTDLSIAAQPAGLLGSFATTTVAADQRTAQCGSGSIYAVLLGSLALTIRRRRRP